MVYIFDMLDLIRPKGRGLRIELIGSYDQITNKSSFKIIEKRRSVSQIITLSKEMWGESGRDDS